MEVNEGSEQTSDIKPHSMAAHACFKNEFTKDEKCHNLMAWFIYIGGVEVPALLNLNIHTSCFSHV